MLVYDPDQPDYKFNSTASVFDLLVEIQQNWQNNKRFLSQPSKSIRAWDCLTKCTWLAYSEAWFVFQILSI